MHREHIKRRIIALILCFAMLLSIIHIENFVNKNISASDNTELTDDKENNSSQTYEEIEQEILNRVEESNDAVDIIIKNFTWRETTNERGIYLGKETSYIGKIWYGENIDEILQMSQDPSVDFDIESMFSGTVFQGLNLDDLLFLQEEGYNDLTMLLRDILNANCYHITEYLFGISLYADYSGVGKVTFLGLVTISGDNAWGKDKVYVYIPTVGRFGIEEGAASTDPRYAKYFSLLGLNYQPAFCIDPSKDYNSDDIFTAKDPSDYFNLDYNTNSWYINEKIRDASAWFIECQYPIRQELGLSSWQEYYVVTQLYCWILQMYPACEKYEYEAYLKDAWCEYQASLDCHRWEKYTEENGHIYFDMDYWQERCNVYRNSGYLASQQGLLTILNYTASDEYEWYVYHDWGTEVKKQRLISGSTPVAIEPEEPETNTDLDEYKNQLSVQHNITGTIDNNGKGVIGSWNGSQKSDPNAWYTICNGITCSSSHSHATTTITKEQSVSKGDLIDLTSYDDYTGWEDYGGTDAHYDYSYYYKEGEPNEYIEGFEGDDDFISKWGTIIRVNTWTSFDCHCYNSALENSVKEHEISKPKVDNYKLTLHYQGGWLNSPTTYTSDMNSMDYDDITYENSHKGGKTSDLTSTERTNVYYVDMTIKGNYKLNTTTSTNVKTAGTLSGNIFTHGTDDGVNTVVEFNYDNYYLVSLPTPVRSGYNFLGWYTASSGGDKIDPVTVSPDGNTYKGVYVIKEDTVLYAQWELVTKDETFTIYWLDNSNNYTTRPSAVYVELWRFTQNSDAEICEGFITEGLNASSNDWINNFSNETGVTTNYGNASNGTNVATHDPNAINNTIFSGEGSYIIKITGNNSVPASENAWFITLDNLQKFDPYNETWEEYTYVIREIKVECLDETVQYYTSPNILHNNYSTSLNKYYNITYDSETMGNLVAESGQGTYNAYRDLDIKTKFSNTVVNRAANVAGPSNWKNIVISASFEDGKVDRYNDDIYHFRPYELKIELYQNYAYGKDPNSDNFLSDEGVRVIYDDPKTDEIDGIKFISHLSNPLSSTIPSSGTMANTLRYTFENVPTVQDNTCIKIAYDVILTHGESRYRYTIDVSDPYNNLDDKYASSHYYANKHETAIKVPLDLDYTTMYNSSTKQYITITKDNMSQINSYRAQGYEFVEDNLNNVYQNYFKQEDDTLYLLGQNNIYTNLGSSVGNKAYSDIYKSMGYNLRYYYIEEDNYLRANPTYYESVYYTDSTKNTQYLFYEETLFWNFTLTLNHEDTPLPDEYTGSASSDDRTGNYNGSTNDDFTHTNNKIIISNTVYNDDKQSVLATDDDYDNLLMDISQEGFLITFKQVEKIWNYSGHDITEGYDTSKYSTNGWVAVDNINTINGSIIKFVSNHSNPSSMITIYDTTDITYVGNEYNIYVPANGSVVMDYLPDGKYEITCHYDIDFDNFNFSFKGTEGTAEFTKEDGKCYLTLSSKDVYTEGNVKHAATIDYWRGYVNDENQIPSYGTIVKYSVWNEKHGGSLNGFNVETNKDEKNPDNFDQDYLEENYKSYE